MSSLSSTLSTALSQIQALKGTIDQLSSSGIKSFSAFADALAAAQSSAQQAVAANVATSSSTSAAKTTTSTPGSNALSLDSLIAQLNSGVSSASNKPVAGTTTTTTATTTATTAASATALGATTMDQLALFKAAIAKGTTNSNGVLKYDFSALDAKYGKTIIGNQLISGNFDADPQLVFEKIVGDNSTAAFASNLSVPYQRTQDGVTTTGGDSLLSLPELVSIAGAADPEQAAAKLVNAKLQPTLAVANTGAGPLVSITDKNGRLMETVLVSKTPEGTVLASADQLQRLAAKYGLTVDNATLTKALLA